MNPRAAQKNLMFLVPVALIVSLCLTLAAAAAADLSDDTLANFSGGTVGSCLVSPSAGDGGIDGEVVLGLGAGGTLETFSGTSLPAGWTSGTYGDSSASLTVSGDVLTLDGSYAGRSSVSSPPRTLDFVATFDATRQHVGLGSDVSLNSGAWALFSTDNNTSGELYVWTSDGILANSNLQSLGTGYLGAPHRYRIEWTTTSVLYYIDGTLVATHNSPTVGADMAPVASDAVVDTPTPIPLIIDWMRMSDYGTSCTFESRVLDGGQLNNTWTTLETTEYTPTGTTLTYETRSGDTSTPDVSWSNYQAVTAGNIASPNSRYIQYRVTLGTTDVRFTPEVRRVAVHGVSPTAVTLSALNAQAHGLGNLPLLAMIVAAGMIVIGVAFRRRQQ